MFELPELPYPYNSLEPFIDEETMHVHHDGHHATYVKNLNNVLEGHDNFLNMEVEQLLKSLDQIPPEIRTKVKNNVGGHYHHSLFWTMLQPGGSKPSGKILAAINQTFGSFEAFQAQFNQQALGLFGSGWTWLVLGDHGLEIVSTPNQDSPISRGQFPLIGIDLWEHAYYLKYKNKRADFIQAWWNVANWDEAENRFSSH
ncbi:superoxide dismutase [Candidatus Daviesbacteria bacterium]|nr:superoxide dismutase [Candidatus Daviesbacteria bacterium]